MYFFPAHLLRYLCLYYYVKKTTIFLVQMHCLPQHSRQFSLPSPASLTIPTKILKLQKNYTRSLQSLKYVVSISRLLYLALNHSLLDVYVLRYKAIDW